ncbi:mannose-1-phosphate guanyltransferase [Paraconiothyrium brasiliense]|uniref:Mannose-1-phosphate guanyltransferase n=1 Tax=Paraconiothyrium brasiliense TaxID=300254 RepID=A0ABR3QIN1_9PLEO
MFSPKRHASPPADPCAEFIDSAVTSAAPSRRTSPQPSHKPNTGLDEEQVYVLTLNLSPSISVPLDQLREEYFPKHLNRTPAHITLFHALPHSQIEVIDATLNRLAARTRPYHISTGKPFRLRRGVAVLLGSGDEQSQHLREELREKWIEWLSQQDSRSRGWQPHWTIMNKVEEEKKVLSTFDTLRRILYEETYHGKALGFDLWKYKTGDWEHVKEYQFRGAGSGASTPGRGARSRRNSLKDEGGLIKTNSWSRMADVWQTVTLGKKGSSSRSESRRTSGSGGMG